MPGAGPRAWQVAVNTGGPPGHTGSRRLRTQAVILFCAVWYVWQKRRPAGSLGLLFMLRASSQGRASGEAGGTVWWGPEYDGLLNKVK